MALTKQQFLTLEDLFNYYNKALFATMLPDTLICLARHKGSAGYFAANRWKSDNINIHEIAINPENILISEIEWHQTLVHEMCHLWQEVFGTPSRKFYHNTEWSNKMIEVGLMPSHNGLPGGKTTGQSMSDYVIEGGLFQMAFNKIHVAAYKHLKLPVMPNLTSFPSHNGQGQSNGDKSSKAGLKVKYTCSCGHNVWGKPGLSLSCKICNEDFE